MKRNVPGANHTPAIFGTRPVGRRLMRFAALCGMVAMLSAPALLATAADGLPAIDTAAAKALLSSDQTLQSLTFADTGSKTVTGKINGYKSTAYVVPAAAGQTLTITMTTPSASAYFNVTDVRDQSGAAVHIGEQQGATATVSVTAATSYLITPYLVRAVARRGSTATYTLTVSRQ